MFTTKTTVLGLALTAVLAHQPLLARGEPAPSAKVAYRDINLGSPNGVAQLNERVRKAARRVCRQSIGYDLSQMRAHRRCLNTAMASAGGQVRTAIASFERTQLAARGIDVASR